MSDPRGESGAVALLRQRAIAARVRAWSEAKAADSSLTPEQFETCGKAIADSCRKYAVMAEEVWP